MSDRVIESYHDSDGRAGQSVDSYQSVWMAHWTQTSSRSAPHVHNHMSSCLENNHVCDAKKYHLLSELEIAPDISTSAKRFTEITEARTVRIMNEGLTTSSKNLIHLYPKNDLGISCHRQVSRPHIDCNIEYNACTTKSEYNGCTTKSHFPSVLAVAPLATETSSRDCHFQLEGVPQNPEELVNSSKVIGDRSLAHVGSCQANFTGSTQMMPYRLNRGKAPVSSFMSRQEKHNQLSSNLASKEHLSNTNLTFLEHEHVKYHGHSALLVCEKKRDNHSTFGKSGTSFLRQRDGSLLLHDPSTGNDHLPMLVGERYQKMQNCSGSGFSPPEATNSENLYPGSYTLQRMPHSIHDVENIRIHTTNSKEGLTGGPATFSQTTHRLLLMEKTDVGLSKENQTFRESRVSTNLKRNLFSEIGLPTPFGLGQHGVKLQPLGSSTDSERNDNVEDVKTPEVCLENESSADTDTMDMDAFKQNYLSGVNSSPSNKDILVVQNPQSQATIVSAGEEVECGAITRLPHINEEIPVLPAAGSSMENADPSTSRTRSLDAEHLLFLAEQPGNPKSSPYPNGPVGLDPSSRWLKRLRPSTSDSFAVGTKCSNLGDASSHKKVNKLFSKIIKGSKTSNLGPTIQKCHGKEEMAADRSATFSQNGESSFVDLAKKDRDILLSHPWIRRWCHNQAATEQKKPEAVVVCEPECTKLEFDELQNKQFPSIAAMALMGKAMYGFQPCEFRRRGSFIVWNTKGC